MWDSWNSSNISIHAPRGGSDQSALEILEVKPDISIHAPRGGSDGFSAVALGQRIEISIHAPRGGSDLGGIGDKLVAVVFQSTLPVGGATNRDEEDVSALAISIHAPRGGSDCDEGNGIHHCKRISIHAPRGGSDCKDAQFSFYIFGKRV